MPADEPRPADDQPVARMLVLSVSDSHFGVDAWSAGWLTSRCQSTAHMPSVCAVTRSSALDRDDDALVRDLRACSRRRGRRRRRPSPRPRGRSRPPRTRLAEMPRSASPPPTEKTSTASPLAEARSLEPRREGRLPAVVVDPCRELGDVVGRRVRLEPAQLPEVACRMRRVSRGPADPEDEEPPARVAHRGERACEAFDRLRVEPARRSRPSRRDTSPRTRSSTPPRRGRPRTC